MNNFKISTAPLCQLCWHLLRFASANFGRPTSYRLPASSHRFVIVFPSRRGEINPSLLCGEVSALADDGVLLIFNSKFLIFNVKSSPLSTLLTSPLKEGKDSNPSMLCGEVSALADDGVLIKEYYIFIIML